MAVIKIVSSKSPLKTAIDYIKRKTPEEQQAGKNLSPDTAFEEMAYIKEEFGKTGGRQYQHLVQSFNPEDKVTPDLANKIGQEFMERNELWKGFQVIMTTHADKKHIHNHFIVNSVNYETGYKIQSSKQDYQKMKDLSNQLSKENNLSIPEYNPNKLTASNTNKYRALEKGLGGQGQSYLLDTYKTVIQVADKAVSRPDFINKMREQGYRTNWTESRKHVTFTNSEGKRVRLANLNKTFKDEKMTKEVLESEFSRNKGRDQRGREHREYLEARAAKLVNADHSYRQQTSELYDHPGETSKRNDRGLQTDAGSLEGSKRESEGRTGISRPRVEGTNESREKTVARDREIQPEDKSESLGTNERTNRYQETGLVGSSEDLRTNPDLDSSISRQPSGNTPTNIIDEVAKLIEQGSKQIEFEQAQERQRLAYQRIKDRESKRNQSRNDYSPDGP